MVVKEILERVFDEVLRPEWDNELFFDATRSKEESV